MKKYNFKGVRKDNESLLSYFVYAENDSCRNGGDCTSSNSNCNNSGYCNATNTPCKNSGYCP